MNLFKVLKIQTAPVHHMKVIRKFHYTLYNHGTAVVPESPRDHDQLAETNKEDEINNCQMANQTSI